MKTMLVLLLSAAFFVSGVVNVMGHIRISNSLDEIVRFINLVRTEVHYTTADFERIVIKAKEQNYKFISFSDNKIFLNSLIDKRISEEFNGFINKIGTTDEAGQMNICNEYKERFEELLSKKRVKEKEKLQVNTALSLFGALSVLIFFL